MAAVLADPSPEVKGGVAAGRMRRRGAGQVAAEARGSGFRRAVAPRRGTDAMDAERTARSPGRPPKFTGPSRVVTVTLPEETLARLAEVDRDRARAIVRVTELAGALPQPGDDPVVTMQAVTPHMAVIAVPRSAVLAGLAGLSLIQVGPSRHLIVLEPGTAVAEVEIAILDALEVLAEADGRDRAILGALLRNLRAARRSGKMRTAALMLVEI